MALRIGVTALLLLAACGGNVEVVRTVSPADALASGLPASAVVRGSSRIAIPADAWLEANRVVVPHHEKVEAADVIEQDALGRVSGVRKGDGRVVRFEPGTADFHAVEDEVRGELVGRPAAITLERGDRIEVHGSFAPDDPLPGGGSVERSRSTGFLVGGVTVLVLSYAPSAYVGAISPRGADRVLLVPVAGPFLDLANRPPCQPIAVARLVGVDPCIEEKLSRGALIVGGAVQSLGTLLFLVGLPTRSTIVPARAGASVRIVPTMNGAAAHGTF